MPLEQIGAVQRAYEQDIHTSTHPVREAVDENVNLSQLGDALTYDKGEAVLGMFERWMGPDTFRKGVIDYLKAHEWKNAVAGDLWSALSKASGQDISSAMGTFLDQPGVPLVSAELLAGGRVVLNQKRLLAYGETAPEQLWKIPVTLR